MTNQTTMPRKNWAIDRENGVRAVFACVAPHGHTFEDVCSALYFSPFRPARRGDQRDKGVRVGDLIECRAEDMSWYAVLMVRAVPEGTGGVFTYVIEKHDFSADMEGSPFKWEYRGQIDKWVLIRDGDVIETRLESPEAASLRADWYEREAQATQARAAYTPSRGRKPRRAKATESVDAA